MQTRETNRLFYKSFQEHDHADWDYDYLGQTVNNSFSSNICPNCNSDFSSFKNINKKSVSIDNNYGDIATFLVSCKSCGWWQIRQEHTISELVIANWAYQYHSILEKIDISNNQVAIKDLRRSLITNWEDRKHISHQRAEDLVQSILKEHLSCDVIRSTANSNAPDGGIDLYICHKNGSIIAGVQVKRRISRNVESVSEIRNFIGALVTKSIRRGIFVTTAESFSRPAQKILESDGLKKHRLKLNLIDSEGLLDLLQSTTPPKSIELPLSLNETTLWTKPDESIQLTTKEILLSQGIIY